LKAIFLGWGRLLFCFREGEKMEEKMKRLLVFIVILISLAGCATTARINKISIGMTKSEVIDIMGNPSSTSGIGKEEGLRYNLYNPSRDIYEEHWVTLLNGNVVKFGRAGDYQK
jgi:hypothetical protein